jgi:hypothetical protein
MEWQDLVLAVGSALFAFALLPTIFSSAKPALTTSLLTGSILAVFTFTYVTLGLHYAAITTGITSALWLTIATQTIIATRR